MTSERFASLINRLFGALCLLISVTASSTFAVHAQAVPHHPKGNSGREAFTATALRIEQTPKLDGLLDEADWKRAVSLTISRSRNRTRDSQPVSAEIRNERDAGQSTLRELVDLIEKAAR